MKIDLVKQRCLAFCGALILAPVAHGNAISSCLIDAARRFEHKPDLLWAIHQVETSGNCNATSPRNKDGSVDIGCMQINSSLLPILKRKFGITQQDLYDPCTNINVGAWVLAKKVRVFGNNWRAIGAYNASSEHKRVIYAWKVNQKLAELRRPS
jgi:soluble lytic murein transglycosylase-like protein